MNKPKKSPIICLCNQVSKERIEKCIASGAQSLDQIFDRTTAGVGPCGGSCRRKLAPMLEHYLQTGEFLENVKEIKRNKRSKRKKT